MHEEVIGQRPGPPGEDAVIALARIHLQRTQTADEHGHLGRAQRQPEGSLDQQVLRGHLVSLSQVVAEPVRVWFQHGEGLDIGLLLRGIRTAWREGHFHIVSRVLRSLFDGRASTQHDQVGERHPFLPAGLRVVEHLLDPLHGPQHFREFRWIVDGPILLRRETDAGAVGAAALVGAAERRRRRPGGRDQLGDRQSRARSLSFRLAMSFASISS